MTPNFAWWKLYLFAALACVTLFLLPPTNQFVLIVWMIVIYGGIAIWLKSNSSAIAAQADPSQITEMTSVAEFMDEDRLYMQLNGGEIIDDSLLHDPREII